MKGFNWKKITKQSEFYVFLIIVVLSVIIQIRSGLFFAKSFYAVWIIPTC